MLSADERLILIRIKIERARKHLRDLAADVLATERKTVVLRSDDIRRRQGTPDGVVVSLGFSMGIPKGQEMRRDVPRFSAEILSGAGDIAHNLRTALDHLMCHLLVLAGSAITKQDGFPISESATRYESRKARMINRVRPEVIEELDKLKPYKGGNDALFLLTRAWKWRSRCSVERSQLELFRSGGTLPYNLG